MTKLKERCPFCGGEIFFEVGQELVRCEWCGQTSQTAKFESESMRIHAALEEGEQAREKLAEAEKEKEKAQKRLNQAVESLDGIYASQKKADQALDRIARDFSQNREEQRNMKALLSAIQGKVNGGEDTLSKLLKMVGKGQQNAGEKLEALQTLSETVLQNQDNMFAAMAVLPQITAKLDMNGKQQQELAGEFMSWFQGIREDDIRRLKSISSASSALMAGQKVLESKIDRLQEEAAKAQNKIDDFHGEYKQDKQKKLQNIIRQAENFMIEKNFDQAAGKYLEAEMEGGADADTCWKKILCHYCVYFQRTEDKKAIPIILNPDLTDPEEMSLRRDFRSLLSAADPEERKYYEGQLANIDEVLDRYRQVRHEAEYDVFISVKQTDDCGRYTRDSDKASDLYDFLKGMGLKVFNSRRSLPAGELYEPRIISAIMSAKVMIVVGSSAENMNADWVKNEWTRFQWLQRREKDSKRKLLCYLTEGMDPYSIPKGLNPDRQAIIDGITAHGALTYALKDLIKKEQSGEMPAAGAAVQNSVDSVLNLMKAWLVTGEYKQVIHKYEQLKDSGLYLDQPKIHLSALCAEKEVSDIERIVDSICLLEEEPMFRMAQEMCRDDEERRELADLNERNKKCREKREKEAKEWHHKAVELCNQKKFSDGFSYFQKAAELDYTEAQIDVGYCYLNGIGIKEDKEKGQYWYRKAAKLGNPEAQYRLACILEEDDSQETFLWMEKAADKGITFAQLWLADKYHDGSIVEKNERLCKYWREKAASYIDPQWSVNNGLSLAKRQFELAEDYINGEKINKDEKRAVYWFEKAAVEEGDIDDWVTAARYQLGKCYEKGIGVEKNVKEAAVWYKKAVDNSESGDALEAVADLLELDVALREQNASDKSIVFKDKEEFLKYFQKFILLGKKHDVPFPVEAMKDIAEKGPDSSGEKWYQKGLAANKQGNQETAFDCYMNAAQMGHANAQNEVGVRYENGTGTPKDVKEAFKWYSKAAEQGNRSAQCNLGLCYEYGRGVGKDMAQAVKWYCKAAENGLPRGQYKLGRCLEQGSGISKDIKKAAEWYRKAANQKYKDAAEKADELESRIKRGEEMLNNRFGIDYGDFLMAAGSITGLSFQTLALCRGEYTHAQMDLIEEVVKKSFQKKETPVSLEEQKRRQELEILRKQYPGAAIPDLDTEIISKEKGLQGKVVVIPSWIREVRGSGISLDKFFPGNSMLEELYILSDNCSIESEAFTKCSNLKKIVMSPSPQLSITDSFFCWNGRADASVSEKGTYIKRVADKLEVDFQGRTDFSKINDAVLRYKAGRCIKCGGEFGFLGKCKNCKEKRI